MHKKVFQLDLVYWAPLIVLVQFKFFVLDVATASANLNMLA